MAAGEGDTGLLTRNNTGPGDEERCTTAQDSDARSLIIINHARPRSWGESFLLYEMDNFYIDMCVHCSTAPSPEINNESQSQKGKGEKKIPRERLKIMTSAPTLMRKVLIIKFCTTMAIGNIKLRAAVRKSL